MKKRLLFKLKQLKSSFERYGLLRIPVLLLLFLFCMAQSYGQVNISGTITDENGEPMIGVSVKVKGTTTGTVTNIDGVYQVQVPGTSSELEFSYVSYLTESVVVGTQTKIDFKMSPDVTSLEEVIVVGYGTQKKSDVTGSIASVNSEDLTQNKTVGFDQALQGKVAGVQISSDNGAPGSAVTVRIRGTSSINQNGGSPMYVVDGVLMGSINSVNPEDIESIEILKDASSAAIYGVSGANGVILISTKKGKAGKAVVNFDYYFGVQNMVNPLDMMTGAEYAETYNEYYHLTGRQDEYDSAEMANMPNTDWMNEVTRTAPIHNINLSASGGSEKGTYMLSLGYMDQNGVVKNSEFERFTIRVNSELKPNKWFEVGENLSVVTTTRYGVEDWQLHNEYNSPITNAIWYQPNVEPYAYDSVQEEWVWVPSPQAGSVNNPMVGIDNENKQNNYYQAYGNAFARINFSKWLTFESRLGGEYNTSRYTQFDPSWYVDVSHQNPNNSLTQRYSFYKFWQWQNFVTFTKTFLGSHNVKILAGSDAWESYTEGIQTIVNSLPSEDPTQVFPSNGSDIDLTMSPDPDKRSRFSYFARLNYDYKSKYLLTVNARYDNSSQFGPNFKDDWFPSFSVGWKFSEEAFIKSLNVFSFGKIRFGWGQVGNDNIQSGAYVAMIGNTPTYNYAFDDENVALGYGPMNASNPDVHWEAVNQTNLGVDLGFFRNKLNVTFEWFKKENEGMLLSAQTPAVSGAYYRDLNAEGNPFYPVINIGNLSNSGIEFSLSYNNVVGKLSYEVSGNLTYVKTLVGDIADNIYYGSGHKGMGAYLNYTQEGHAIAEFYGYEADGIFTHDDAEWQDADGYGVEDGEFEWVVTNQAYWTDTAGFNHYAQPDAKPGDIRFVEHELNDTVDDGDQTWIGNPNPDVYAGLTIRLSYGIVDFSALVQGVFGNQIYNTVVLNGYNNTAEFNWDQTFLNRYSDTIYDRRGNVLSYGNVNGDVMRMALADLNGNYNNSTYFVEDGWYIRMKDLQIGVNLPSKWMNAIKFNKFRVYGGVQNLFTITEYTGLDPEVASGNDQSTSMLTKGIDIGSYPYARTWYCGLQLGF